MREARDGSLSSRAAKLPVTSFHGYQIHRIALALTLVLISVSRSHFLVSLHAAAHSLPSLPERAPWCARFQHHNFYTDPMWDIYRKLDWYVIYLQLATSLFYHPFSPGGGQPPFVLEILPVSEVSICLSSGLTRASRFWEHSKFSISPRPP